MSVHVFDEMAPSLGKRKNMRCGSFAARGAVHDVVCSAGFTCRAESLRRPYLQAELSI